MRSYGAEGLRAHIRRQVGLANEFHQLVSADPRFQLPVPAAMGLVCFRLKVPNRLVIVAYIHPRLLLVMDLFSCRERTK